MPGHWRRQDRFSRRVKDLGLVSSFGGFDNLCGGVFMKQEGF